MRNTDEQIDREAAAYRDMLLRETAAYERFAREQAAMAVERAVLADVTHTRDAL